MKERHISRMTYASMVHSCLRIGPPIGLLTLLLVVFLNGTQHYVIGDMFFAVIFGLIVCYFYGGMQALFGGFALAETASRFGRIPVVLPIALTGLFSTIVYVWFNDILGASLRSNDEIMCLTLTHLAPAIACWYRCRKLLQAEKIK